MGSPLIKYTGIPAIDISNTRAVKLYQDLGFNEIGNRKGYYPAKKGREDALVMARML